MISKRTFLFFILLATAILLMDDALPGLAAEVSPASGPSEYHWQHNPFIPLLTPKVADVRANKGGQAAPYEDFSLPPDLKLKAVIKCGDRYKAIVGDQLVVSDDRVMGFVVVEVQADRVVLLKDGRVVELSLRPMVNNRGNFTINRTNDHASVNIPHAGQSADDAKGQNGFIRLVNLGGESGFSPAE